MAPELLTKLLTAAGPSGSETEVARVWREYCRTFATDVSADSLGSSRARVPGTRNGPTLAVVGHIDEIGLHITHIDDEGYLRFGDVGGWDAAVLVGQRVRIHTRRGPRGRSDRAQADPPAQGRGAQEGPRAAVSAHRYRRRERRGGSSHGQDRRSRGRRRRADGAWPTGELSGRALDNRLGCYVVAEAARLVARRRAAPPAT